MKIPMPFTPKAKLLELLTRRGQTLGDWVKEMGITTPLTLELYCVKHKLVLPEIQELLTAFAMPRPVLQSYTLTPAPVMEETKAVDVPAKPSDEEETTKKSKKVRNALVKTAEPSAHDTKSVEEPENKAS